MNELREFLVEAKKNTYANANIEKQPSSRQGSNDYEYSNEKYTYHDTYFGGTRFAGEEVVYEAGSNQPFWGMNYYGVTLDSSFSEEAMDKALRPALMMVGQDETVIPVRGPKHFENDGYVYTFKVEGDLEYFNGIETVSKDGHKIYELHCTGGRII